MLAMNFFIGLEIVILLPGDSYIVLHTKQAAGGKLLHDIHFWQGKESTQVSHAFIKCIIIL